MAVVLATMFKLWFGQIRGSSAATITGSHLKLTESLSTK